MTINKKIILAIVALFIVSFLLYPTVTHAPVRDLGQKPQVSVSFLPYSLITTQIAGDKVSVTSIVQPGIEPHDFDPKPSQIRKILDSDLFIYNGAGLEPWAEKVVKDQITTSTTTLNASTLVDTISQNGVTDPHLWLDPINTVKIADSIGKNLEKIDPANYDFYLKRLNSFKAELRDIDLKYQALSKCPTKEIVTSHEALGYLSKRYNFKITSIQGLSPDQEPSLRELVDLINKIKTDKIKYILVEDLVSPKYAETIQKETSAELIPFHSMEGLPQNLPNATYTELQLDNIKALEKALQCPIKS